MSVGWKRQYEGEAIYNFARILLMMQRDDKSPELAAYAQNVRLKVIMQITLENQDTQRGNVGRDRINDCAECRRHHGGECQRKIRPDGRCIYDTPEAKLAAIRKHFGDEGLRWVERAGTWAGKALEAANGNKD